MRKTYVIIAAIIVLFALLEVLLFSFGILPKNVLAKDDTIKYALDMAGVVQLLVAIPLGMKLRNRPPVWLALFGGVIHYGLLVFFLTNSATTLGCAAIAAVVLLLLCILPPKE